MPLNEFSSVPDSAASVPTPYSKKARNNAKQRTDSAATLRPKKHCAAPLTHKALKLTESSAVGGLPWHPAA